MAPELSFIIVSWNARKFLLDCLASIEETRGELTVEIIVVDNGSTDGSGAAVKEHFPQVNLIETGENLGFAKANNIGLRAAAGRYYCLVNSDVVLLPGCQQQLLETMDSHPRIGLGGPRVLNADRTLQHSCRRLPTLLNLFARALALDTLFPRVERLAGSFMYYFNHGEMREVEALSGCCWIARREAVEQVGLLDERFFIYSEDIDWCKRFHDAGWAVTFLPQAEVIHFGGASSGNEPLRFYLEMQRAKRQYWRKHHGLFSQFVYWKLALLDHALHAAGAMLSYLVKRSDKQEIRHRINRRLACLAWLLGRPMRSSPRPDSNGGATKRAG